MASVVGRSAVLRGVERKSTGRSDYMNVYSMKETVKMGKRNEPFNLEYKPRQRAWRWQTGSLKKGLEAGRGLVELVW